MKTKVIVIIGPTAVGKTSLSIEIAKRFNGEIISGDSQQVYKKLDIGTAKITPEEQEGIPHPLKYLTLIDRLKYPHEKLNHPNDSLPVDFEYKALFLPQ